MPLVPSLLNLKNVPNERISGNNINWIYNSYILLKSILPGIGLTEDLMDFIANESGQRYILELDPQFIAENNQMAADLPELTAEQLADLDGIEMDNQPSSTSSQTRQHIKKFKNFLLNKGLCANFETVPDNYLSDYLRYFYGTTRKDDGSLYAPASLVCMHACDTMHVVS